MTAKILTMYVFLPEFYVLYIVVHQLCIDTHKHADFIVKMNIRCGYNTVCFDSHVEFIF